MVHRLSSLAGGKGVMALPPYIGLGGAGSSGEAVQSLPRAHSQ